MQVLSTEECLALLDSVRLGRIALTDHALPIILPLVFARIDDRLLFKVGPGAVSRAAQLGHVVCFEADSFGDAHDQAWSVTAIGRLSIVTDPTMLQRVDQVDLAPWSAACSTVASLVPEVINGRRRIGGPAA